MIFTSHKTNSSTVYDLTRQQIFQWEKDWYIYETVRKIKVLYIIQEYFRTKSNSLPHLLYVPINMNKFSSVIMRIRTCPLTGNGKGSKSEKFPIFTPGCVLS